MSVEGFIGFFSPCVNLCFQFVRVGWLDLFLSLYRPVDECPRSFSVTELVDIHIVKLKHVQYHAVRRVVEIFDADLGLADEEDGLYRFDTEYEFQSVERFTAVTEVAEQNFATLQGIFTMEFAVGNLLVLVQQPNNGQVRLVAVVAAENETLLLRTELRQVALASLVQDAVLHTVDEVVPEVRDVELGEPLVELVFLQELVDVRDGEALAVVERTVLVRFGDGNIFLCKFYCFHTENIAIPIDKVNTSSYISLQRYRNMSNKSDLLNTINANAEKHEAEVKTQYLEMAEKYEKAFISIAQREDEFKEMCEIANAYLLKDPDARTVTTGSRVIFERSCCGRNGYGLEGLCPIEYVTSNFVVVMYPGGPLWVNKPGIPLMNFKDVTGEIKNILTMLKEGRNDSVVRITDNYWIKGWSIAEAVIAINKHFDTLKENLTKAVKHEGDENMVIWRTEGQSIRIPRLTKEEIEKIKKFVTETPPTGDACSKIFNQLIRFAREVFDAQEAG